MKYRMLTSAGTRGAETKRWRGWVPGQVIEAPEGEFAHLEKKHYEILPDDGEGGDGEGAGGDGGGETTDNPPVVETATNPPGGETADVTPVNATQSAIELADEHGIDLSAITGTGAGGKITKGDVENAIG